MAKQFDEVSCKYGAPMGRRDSRGDGDAPYKMRLFKVKIDSQGYDDGGAYWGLGETLYCATSEELCDEVTDIKTGERVTLEYFEGDATMYFRASDRSKAKEHVLRQYSKAKFYR